ncbi:tyrosine-type recombinase/integrase [Streptomyces sp. NPDC101237]|uniref:tyrosine-type recombinase/integrase n=1 Tax=Streptomyces sp. NPDC101237 TaxID=3366139 RepID=UPI003819BE52
MVPTADHGIGKRWQVRYRDLDGHQRKENSHTKAQADNRAAEADVEIRQGSYVVPAETKQTLVAYAQNPRATGSGQCPLSAQLAAALKARMKEFPPVEVTLPWTKPDGEPKTFRLLFVDQEGRAYNRSVFDMGDWRRALAAVGVIPPRARSARYLQVAPEDGMHALRHAYASVLLDAGESIKALSDYLGHSDPGFTLRTYTHLLPSSETRTRKAIDDVFTEAEAEAGAEDEDDRPGTQGTSAPQRNPCALNVPWPPDGPLRHQKGRGPKTPPATSKTPGQGHTRQ